MDFSQIILDEEETAEALRKGREEKFYRLKRIAYMESLTKPKEIRRFTYDEMYKALSDVIMVDRDDEEVVRLLCMYFTADERFELEGHSLSKGLCLFGGVGVGKTMLMKKFAKNQLQSYVVLMCRQIEDEYSQNGEGVLKQYAVPRQTAVNADPFGHQVLGYCFDDLGTEPLAKYYGKEVNVLAEVILNRYDNDLPFNQTHITTNLSIEEIRQRYGSRVTDRMRQMFNLIGFPEGAKSRRQ